MPNVPLLAALCLASLAVPALAQDAAPPSVPAVEEPSGAVSASILIEALQPTLDDAGQPALDAAGEPILAFQPLAEDTTLTPGDAFRYIVTIDNAGADVEAMRVALDIPASGRLLPATVTASAEATFELGSTVDPALVEPLLVEVDGVEVENPRWAAAPDRFDLLVATFDRLPGGTAATVAYDLVVR